MSSETPQPILFVAGDLAYERVGEPERGPRGEQVFVACRARSYVPLVRVKRLPKVASRKAIARMREEVRLASLLEHPHIERLQGLYEYQGSLYAVSDYLLDLSLRDVYTLALACKRRLSEAFALFICSSVAAALHHTHSLVDSEGRPLRVVHRDVSPASVRIGHQGEVKLADFGLAYSLLPGRLPTTLSGVGGGLCYASPEQILGLPVDARSDLFSLGLVLLELLTHRHLFAPGREDLGEIVKDLEALSPEDLAEFEAALQELVAESTSIEQVIERHMQLVAAAQSLVPEQVEELTEGVPEPTRAILRRLLRKDPSERYQTAAEVEGALRERLVALGGFDSENAAEELLVLRVVREGSTEEAAHLAFRTMRQGLRRGGEDSTTPTH